MAFQLYDYQKRVGHLIRSGKSVILQAPTGSGKTMAALWPYLEMFDRNQPDSTPQKCLYVVPMRILANQFEAEAKNLIQRRMVLSRQPRVTIQTGDRPEDKRFEGDLIFCTVDQFLSSYLTMPYSLSYRLANLNAGATVGAYIVLDEFHLLDPQSTLQSVLYAIKRLSRVTPVLLMTATFSATMLDDLAHEIQAEKVLLPPAETLAIDTRDGKSQRQRRWRVASDQMDARVIVEQHKHRSLVICNTVKRAREMYRSICEETKLQCRFDTTVRLLHSQFLRDDRNRTEEELRHQFGKDVDRSEGSYIVVATQTIEVGVDASAEVLHTELAPASALIQRAGRCARFPGEIGEVIVYPVESYRPYSDDKTGESLWAREMTEAFGWLQQHDGETFDFEKEQAFVNAVATERDRRVLFNLSAGEPDRRNAIHRALNGDREGMSRLLVRDADSRLVLIHPEPKQLLDAPYSAVGFSIQPESLYSMVRDWLNRPNVDVEWCVKYLFEDGASGKGDGYRVDYDWKPLNDEKLVGIARVVVVNPALAGYSPSEGFLPDRGGTPFVSTITAGTQESQWERPSYRLESYTDHLKRVLAGFRELALPELRSAAPALERAANWPSGSVLRSAWLACLLHDVGKLSVAWQGWARAYQRQIGEPVDDTFAIAHTTYDPRNLQHKAAESVVRVKHPKSTHAGEGALACAPMIIRALGKENTCLARAVMTAVTRHHTPYAHECGPFVLRKDAADHIRSTLAFTPQDVAQSLNVDMLLVKDRSANEFGNQLSTPDNDFGWMAYILLARALRRSDQRGTELGSR